MMTTSGTDVFHSHHEVMDALNQNYAGSDDAQRATTVNKLHQDIATVCQRQEVDARTAIIGIIAALLQPCCGLAADLQDLSTCSGVQSCLSKCGILRRKQLPRRLLRLIKSGCIS